MNLDAIALARLTAVDLPHALFITVSGSHLYGFSSIDSDVDLRGAFLAPLDHVVGILNFNETIERKYDYNGTEVELVAHEARKYLCLLTRNNGYVLEQVFSPLVVSGREFLEQLRPLAARCATRHCYHHYRGFYQTQRKMLEQQSEKKAKSLLYAYRVLMTGIHLLRTGKVVADILRLNEVFEFSFVDDLIAQKRSAEFGALQGLDWEWHQSELQRLESLLDQAFSDSKLPETAPVEDVHQFLVEWRLRT